MIFEGMLGALCLVGLRFAGPHKPEPREDDADKSCCSFIDWKIEQQKRERMRGQR
jgi:hypothetical protein